MKILMKHKMTFEEADQLIERYYDGLTNVEEERQLKEFLLQPDLPSRYEPEQAIFDYFKPELNVRKLNIHPLMRWVAVAAIISLGVFSIQIFTPDVRASYAYVDGKKITDLNEVKLQAMATLNEMPSGNEEVEESIESLNNKDIIKQQLEMFASFE